MIAEGLAAACRLISGGAVQWHCDPNTDVQRIYFGNHSSHLDFIFIWSALPKKTRRFARPVAGRDYWEQGALRGYLAGRVFRAVLVERGHTGTGTAAVAARISIQHMANEMGERDSLIVFPEGTRSLNGEVGAFKSGLYHLARLRPDAELIPVYLENLNRILPKGELLPVPMLSRVVFGPRMHIRVTEDKHEFLARARAALMQLKAV
jgi:1-acyl-sn-glycerol-3-phosphate acyltransferase